MKLSAHLLASSAAGGAAWALSGSAGMAAACLAGGVLLDLDHLPDYLLDTEEPPTLRGFFAWCYELKWRKVYLLLHSYELLALLAAACFFSPGPALRGFALGMALHLAMDQLGNTALDRRFYFLVFRYRAGFVRELLAAPRPGGVR